MTKISKHDLDRAIQLRKDEIAKSAPERYSIVKPTSRGHLISDINKGEEVGNTYIRNLNDGIHMGEVYNTTENVANGTSASIHGIYERALNSGINIAHSDGFPGIISGEELLSAPKTYHIL